MTAVYNPSANYANYKYNGKELQETGAYDYGWRQYMPDLGRWFGVDKLAESYLSTSPYAYVMNNPIMMYDPDGRSGNWWDNVWTDAGINGTTTYTNFDSNGNWGSSTFSPFAQQGTATSFYNFLSGGGTGSYTYATNAPGRDMGGYNSSGMSVSMSGVDFHKITIKDNGFWNDIWDSDFVRGFTGDFINIGGGFSGISGGGAGVSWEANWVLHGPQASFLPAFTTTPSVGGGYNVDITINVGNADYTGAAADINRGMLITNTSKGDKPTMWGAGSISAGGEIGVTGTFTPTPKGSIIGIQLNVGGGIPLGPVPFNGSAGVSNTYLMKDLYKP